MAVSRRGIAISRRGMQKYTIFSWFCSCYLAPSPISRNSSNSCLLYNFVKDVLAVTCRDAFLRLGKQG